MKKSRTNRARRKSSAELYSAVSQSCTLRGAGTFGFPFDSPSALRGSFVQSADCKSAIQQITNLRYLVFIAQSYTLLYGRVALCAALQRAVPPPVRNPEL